MKNISKQIVLVGGGYASIHAYRSIVDDLMIEMMMGQVSIKLICPEEFHFFHGWTAETLTGIIRDQNRLSPLAEVFKYAEWIRGIATHINTDAHIVYAKMNDGSHLAVPYDHLLLGTGSADNTAIEGLAENAYQLKSHPGYKRTKGQIQKLISEAAVPDPFSAAQELIFVVAGGGFTGVEIAANLAEMMGVLKTKFPALRKITTHIKLISSRRELLPGLEKGLGRMQKYAEKMLVSHGIEIIYSTKIVRVTDQGAYLSDGSFINSRMVISAVGQSRITLIGTENMERDSEKRIVTNSFLQIVKHRNIWGAGDAVHVTKPNTKKTCPSNALWAIKQGKHAGKNIVRAILKQNLKPFTYKGLGQCASLGIGKGVGELYGMSFTGWTAWIMRWFFFQYFMPSKKVMWREISDWFYLLIAGKRKDLNIHREASHRFYTREKIRTSNSNQNILLQINRI